MCPDACTHIANGSRSGSGQVLTSFVHTQAFTTSHTAGGNMDDGGDAGVDERVCGVLQERQVLTPSFTAELRSVLNARINPPAPPSESTDSQPVLVAFLAGFSRSRPVTVFNSIVKQPRFKN